MIGYSPRSPVQAWQVVHVHEKENVDWRQWFESVSLGAVAVGACEGSDDDVYTWKKGWVGTLNTRREREKSGLAVDNTQ